MAGERQRAVGIDIINLHKSYRSLHVLRGVSLQIHPGEIMVIVGGSGQGKSVLLRHMIGLENPDTGRIVLDGMELAHFLRLDADRKPFRISMVFQNSALLNSLTVAENVSLRLREQRSLSSGEIERIVNTCLAQVELQESGDKMPGELSGGMKKRVAIARALAVDPQVILYDEPTADLDPLLTAQIGALIKRIQQLRGATQVVVSHNLLLAQRVADHVALLHEGRIVDYQTPGSLRDSQNPLTREFLRAMNLQL